MNSNPEMNPAPTQLVRFLMVEDDDDHAALTERSLKRARILNTVDRVVDGADAIEYLDGREPYTDRFLPDIILLDLNLPKVQGIEVLKFIREHENPAISSLVVVILTTSAAQEDLIKAYKHHVNSYLLKPVDFSQFKGMVDSLSLYWGIWNHGPKRNLEE